MKYEEPVVFNLLDDKQRGEAAAHVKKELARVDEEIEQGARDYKMLLEIDAALSKIQELLYEMRGLAERATDPKANRESLSDQFESCKAQIDIIAAEQCARWSAAESAHLRKMIDELEFAPLE